MSTLKVNAISDAAGANGNAITLATDGTCTAKVTNNLSNRNIVINGNFAIWQRGTSGVNTSANNYLADRFKAMSSSDGEAAVTRDTDTPTAAEAGTKFPYSLKVDVSTADSSLAANQYAIITQRIEGNNLSRLGFGIAGTRYFTLQFWVKAPAGTYYLSFRNSAYNRYYLKAYTVSSGDTWEKKTMTIPVDTSGTWVSDNGQGLDVQWSLGTGATAGTVDAWTAGTSHAGSSQYNLLSSTSNNFFLTGVQLEVGSVATDFEHRSYGDELAKCQRYLWRIDGNHTITLIKNGMWETQEFFFPVPMRASPTLSYGKSLYLRDLNDTGNNSYTGLSISTFKEAFHLNSSTTNNSNFCSFTFAGDNYLQAEAEL
jgi:hypothetical protein